MFFKLRINYKLAGQSCGSKACAPLSGTLAKFQSSTDLEEMCHYSSGRKTFTECDKTVYYKGPTHLIDFDKIVNFGHVNKEVIEKSRFCQHKSSTQGKVYTEPPVVEVQVCPTPYGKYVLEIKQTTTTTQDYGKCIVSHETLDKQSNTYYNYNSKNHDSVVALCMKPHEGTMFVSNVSELKHEIEVSATNDTTRSTIANEFETMTHQHWIPQSLICVKMRGDYDITDVNMKGTGCQPTVTQTGKKKMWCSICYCHTRS